MIMLWIVWAIIVASVASSGILWLIGRDRSGLRIEESKTPYDYALANARADNNRYRDELFTIKALKRTEADTERIRNEIDTILSDDGEEATEGSYDEERRRREFIAVGKRWEANMKELHGDWEIPRIVKPTSDGRGYIPIQQHDDGTVTPIPSLHIGMTAEEAAWDAGAVARAYAIQGTNVRKDEADSPTSWDARMSLEEWAKGVSKAFASGYGTNVREDDTKDEQPTEYDVERSYLELIDKAIHSEQKVLCIYRSNTGEGLSGNELAVGTIVNFRYHNGQSRYLTLRVRNTHKGGTHIMHISGEYLDEVNLVGGESHGEIIYRKDGI